MLLPKTLVRIFILVFGYLTVFDPISENNLIRHFSAYDRDYGVIHNYATETTTLNEENHDDDENSWINKDYQKVTNL